MAHLEDLHEAGILHNLHVRYRKDKIYVRFIKYVRFKVILPIGGLNQTNLLVEVYCNKGAGVSKHLCMAYNVVVEISSLNALINVKSLCAKADHTNFASSL